MTSINDQPEHHEYQHAEVNHDVDTKLTVGDFVVKQGIARFLFAADTPQNLQLGLKFALGMDLKMTIKPLYPARICMAGGKDKAHIRLQGNNIDKTIALISGQNINVDLDVLDGEVIRFTLNNAYEKNCGRAQLSLAEKNYAQFYPIVFVLVWLLVLLALRYLDLSIVFGIVGLTINLGIVYANSTISILNFTNLTNALYLALSLVGTSILINFLPINRAIRFVLCIITMLSFFSLIIIYGGHFLLFGAPVSSDTIHAILQSDTQEIIEFLDSFVGLKKIVYTLIGIALTALLAMQMSAKSSGRKLITGGFGCLLLVPVLATLHSQILRTPILYNFESARTQYFSELSAFMLLKESRSKAISLSDLSLTKTGHKLVVVIGESANKNHMSLYGYARDTTPIADSLNNSGDLIRFDRAYASHTHTKPALAKALTSADQYSGRNWTTSPSLLELSNELGIDNTWITNQQMLGAWDNHVSAIAQGAKRIIYRNKLVGIAKNALKNDGVLIDDLKNVLSDDNETQLIFMHLQGSHASYCSRFPEDIAPFAGEIVSLSEYGSLAAYVHRANNRVVNCYDNSIHYTDKVIGDVIKILDEQEAPTSMLYFADHSEDVISNKAHNSAIFTYAMAEIPLFFWASDSWKQRYTDSWNNLKSNRRKIFTNDHIFESVSGLLGLVSPQIDVRNDLSSREFIEVAKPTTLTGRKSLTQDDNWQYWQQSNINQIVDKAECSRLIPHRANSIGKIRSAIENGLCGFEVDVIFGNDGGQPIFNVGHDSKTQTGISLDNLFEKVPLNKVDKIWLDIKAVQKSQIPQMLERLNYLDEKYGIKSKAIVETSFHGKSVRIISNAGYQLSYYMPTSLLNSAMASSQESSKVAIGIGRQIEVMQPSVISFDLKFYPFVKKYLEPLIETKIHGYHTWFPQGLAMPTPNLLDHLSTKDYYRDEKVKTILLRYHSPFGI